MSESVANPGSADVSGSAQLTFNGTILDSGDFMQVIKLYEHLILLTWIPTITERK